MNAVITGVGGYVPDYRLDNDEMSRMVETNDEWIMSHVGIRERRILKEEGAGSSFMGAKAVEELLRKTGVDKDEIDCLICSTTTPDHAFPNCSAMILKRLGMSKAFGFDISVACCGFIEVLEVGSNFIKSGKYKKVIVMSAETMSSITNYEDRTTCPLFGDGAAAVLLEPTEGNAGLIDTEFHTDGEGNENLLLKAGGSAYPATVERIQNHEHQLYQKGPFVYKFAVTRMAEVAANMMKRNNLSADDVQWFIPHQANLRIIDSAVERMGISNDKVIINIEHLGNTSSATIALCLWEFEKKFKEGDNMIFAAFGAGFSWGAVYVKWGKLRY